MRSTNKIESIQKRTLQLLYNDYTSTYDSLLTKPNKPAMEIKRYRTLALEICKTINDLNQPNNSRCNNKYKHVWNEKP